MRWRRLGWVLAGLFVVCVVLGASSIIIVDESSFVLVTDFGRTSKVLGVSTNESGPHLKAPWQTVYRIDRRLQFCDPPAREMLTGDKKNLDVSSYVVWRVADPVLFLKSAGTTRDAEARLNERVTAALADALGRRELNALISTDQKTWALDSFTTDVLKSVAGNARQELGIELVDVRIRRFNHPTEVRPAIFELIRSERKQVASRLRAEGEAQFQILTSQAERERAAILSKAEAEAERIRGHADAEATRIANKAQARDPRFADFLRTLDAYRTLLDDRTTLVLSAASPLLKMLSEGPPPTALEPGASSKSVKSDQRPTNAANAPAIGARP